MKDASQLPRIPKERTGCQRLFAPLFWLLITDVSYPLTISSDSPTIHLFCMYHSSEHNNDNRNPDIVRSSEERECLLGNSGGVVHLDEKLWIIRLVLPSG